MIGNKWVNKKIVINVVMERKVGDVIRSDVIVGIIVDGVVFIEEGIFEM